MPPTGTPGPARDLGAACGRTEIGVKKLFDFTVYRDPRFYCSFPSVAALPNGDALVVFRRARDQRSIRSAFAGPGDPDLQSVDHVDPRSELAQIRLSPSLETASEAAGLPVNPEAGDQDANLLLLESGRLLLGGFSWYPYSAMHREVVEFYDGGRIGSQETTGTLFLFWGGYTRLSDDQGQTWSAHRYLPGIPDLPDIVPGKRPQHGGAIRGRPIEAANGTLFLPGYAGMKDYNGQFSSHLLASDDQGETWAFRSRVALDTKGRYGFAEPALYQTPSGRLVMFHRTAGLDDRLVTAKSDDGGQTWSIWRTHGIRGHPYDVLPLDETSAFLVYGYRHEPYGIRARLIDSECKDMDRTEEIILRDDIKSPDLGYPWATQLKDGRILVVYYLSDQEGVRHIGGSVLLRS